MIECIPIKEMINFADSMICIRPDTPVDRSGKHSPNTAFHGNRTGLQLYSCGEKEVIGRRKEQQIQAKEQTGHAKECKIYVKEHKVYAKECKKHVKEHKKRAKE